MVTGSIGSFDPETQTYTDGTMSTHRAGPPWRKRLLLGGAVLVSAALIVFGVHGLWDRHEATHRDPEAPLAVGELDETPVATDTCEAADDEPKLIALGALNVKGCITKVGVTDGQLDSPANIHVAGWYTGSALPGSGDGLSIIDGHSSGRYKDGIFNQIDEFSTGEIFTIEYGDGSVRRFEVTSVGTHKVSETMTAMRSGARQQDADLALITCGGDYDADDHSFDRRVVVLATTT